MGHLGIANKYLQAMGYDAISQTVHRILPLGRICNPTASNISICNAIQNRLWQH